LAAIDPDLAVRHPTEWKQKFPRILSLEIGWRSEVKG